MGIALDPTVADAESLQSVLIPEQIQREFEPFLLQLADLSQLPVLLGLAVVEGGPLADHVVVNYAALFLVLRDFAVDAVEGVEECLAA